MTLPVEMALSSCILTKFSVALVSYNLILDNCKERSKIFWSYSSFSYMDECSPFTNRLNILRFWGGTGIYAFDHFQNEYFAKYFHLIRKTRNIWPTFSLKSLVQKANHKNNAKWIKLLSIIIGQNVHYSYLSQHWHPRSCLQMGGIK